MSDPFPRLRLLLTGTATWASGPRCAVAGACSGAPSTFPTTTRQPPPEVRLPLTDIFERLLTHTGVAWSTYLIFVAFECTGVIFALLLSPTRKVVRHDGSRVQMPEKLSWKQEISVLGRALREKKVRARFPAGAYILTRCRYWQCSCRVSSASSMAAPWART